MAKAIIKKLTVEVPETLVQRLAVEAALTRRTMSQVAWEIFEATLPRVPARTAQRARKR